MRAVVLVVLAVAAAVVAFDRYNRKLEAAMRLPSGSEIRHPSIPGSLGPYVLTEARHQFILDEVHQLPPDLLDRIRAIPRDGFEPEKRRAAR